MMQTKEGKKIATIAYLTIVGTVVAIIMNNEEKDRFASFHIRQALGISLTYFALAYFMGYFDSWAVSSAFWLFSFILWLYGFLTALQSQARPVPLVGEFYQRLFKSVN